MFAVKSLNMNEYLRPTTLVLFLSTLVLFLSILVLFLSRIGQRWYFQNFRKDILKEKSLSLLKLKIN